LSQTYSPSSGVDADADAPRPRRRWPWRMVANFVGPALIIGVLVYLVASHGDQVSAATSRVSLWDLVIVTVLALITFLARTEAVLACLAAMGNPPSRRDLHAANSLTMLAAMINHYISAGVRGALVRRIDPRRAPTIPQMILVDASASLIEGMLVLILIIISASALKLAWWLPVLLLIGGVGAFATALVVRRRFTERAVFRGLDVLAHSRQRTAVAGLMVIVIACQVIRTMTVLTAVGLHPSLLQAVATFVAAGVLSSLFAGPGVGTASAPLLVFGHSSIAASTAAGLVLSGSALLAAVIYSLLGGPVFLWRLRHATP
jgi:hypothetical protein